MSAAAADTVTFERRHLAHAGVYDPFGRELIHAQVADHYRHLLSDPVMRLAKHAAKHKDQPDHEIHQDLAEAVKGRMRGVWRLAKYDAPVEYYAAKWLGVDPKTIADFHHCDQETQARALAALARQHKPENDVWEEFDNLFLTAGVTALWQIAEGNASAANSGAGAAGANAVLNNAQAMIGVGDSTTAASAGQTDLQASTNKTYVGMDATYPTQSTNQTVFRATFGSGSANYAWQEFVVNNRNGSNSTTSGGTTLDRVVSSQGTKASGQTWQPSLTLTIS